MPQQVTEIKRFIEICRRKDASSVRIKKTPKAKETKFKVRGHRYLYTLTLKDSVKAAKLKDSLPPGLAVSDIGKKNKKGKHTS